MACDLGPIYGPEHGAPTHILHTTQAVIRKKKLSTDIIIIVADKEPDVNA